MAVTTAAAGAGAWFAGRRGIVALVLLGIAAVVAVGILTRAGYSGTAGTGTPAANPIARTINQGVNGLKTVAEMLAGRSPGERAAGALASLKQKRIAAPHERALPKIRRTAPASPLSQYVAPPAAAAPIPPPPVAPLFSAVTAMPPATATVAEVAPTVFPAMSSPPSGGFVVPPVVTQATPTPPAAAVPEPESWALMLTGFAMIGRALRRRRIRVASPVAL